MNRDELKKVFRGSPEIAPSVVFKERVDSIKFDMEVADVLYYLNLIALGRGNDLAHYAHLSYEKALKPPQKD